MARGRIIKPEFWDDEKLARISRDARLVFIGLWNYSDDYGVVKGNHVWLKNHIFPYDEILSVEDFDKWMREIQDINLIVPFTYDGELYYFIRNFLKHQTINKPSKQRNPEPPENIPEYSGSATAPLPSETEVEIEIENKALSKDKAGGKPPSFSKLPKAGSKHYAMKLPNVKEIERLCYQISKLGNARFNPYQLVQKFTNENKHPAAIFEALEGLIKMWPEIQNPWTYGEAIIKTKSGNYYEAEHAKQAENFKKEWNELAKNFFN